MGSKCFAHFLDHCLVGALWAGTYYTSRTRQLQLKRWEDLA
jgi:hypothetical protein